MRRLLRIGGVPYGVGAPLVRGLAEDPSVELQRDVPTGLVQRLRAGTLDAALVSSIEGHRRPGYAALAGYGIASRDEARSVRAFRRPGRPIHRVGVDAGSETSVALLRVLLDRVMGAREYTVERIEPDVNVDAYPHDLVLLIGDNGLRAHTALREVIDLGTEWRAWTGLPFVFALWLIAPGADRAAIAACLTRAAEAGPLVDSTNGAIHYRLDAEDHRGLTRFATEAAALGLAEPGLAPTFLAASSPAQKTSP